MSLSGGSDFESLTAEAMIEVNRICNRFEEQWRAGQQPAIEEFLDQIETAQHDVLICELLPLEIEYRRRTGLKVTAELFQQRFPRIDETWLAQLLKDSEPATEGKRTDPTSAIPQKLGDYLILRRLGSGGMGDVYEAVHERMDRRVAVKVLRPQVAADPQAVERFLRETRAAAKLSHPNIVAAYDAGEDQGIAFLVTEYVAGQDLHSVVNERGPLCAPEAVDYLLQAARGLSYAHDQGFIHRDVKPANLLLGDDGCVKLLDMGLARSGSPDDSTLTGSSMLLGTAAYMAPEQAARPKDVDHRADIYGLGCTLYFLLTGGPMYEAQSSIDAVLAHRNEPIPSLTSAAGAAAQPFEAVFRKMTAKNRADRYASMGEVIAALQECQSKLGEDTAPAASLGALAAKHVWMAAGAAGLVVILAMVLFSSLFGASRQRAEPASSPEPPPAMQPVADQWGLELNGISSYIWAPLQEPPSNAVTLEAIVTLHRNQLGIVVAWQYDDDYLVLAQNLEGYWAMGRRFRAGVDEFDTEFFNSVSKLPLDKQLHVAVTFDDREIGLFVDGVRQEIHRTDYTLIPFGDNGVFLGGKPDPDTPDEVFFASPMVVHAVCISNEVRYTNDFDPPINLAASETDRAIGVFPLEEGRGETAYDAIHNTSAIIVNGQWVQP